MARSKYRRNDYGGTANINSPTYEVTLEAHVSEYFKRVAESAAAADPRVDPGLAFDVGAYVGSSIPRIRAMGFVRVVCFEPDPSTLATLRIHYGADPNVEVVATALSDRDGELTLYQCDRGRPFLNTADPSWIRDTRHKNLVTNLTEIRVPVTTLDAFVAERVPAYVKIDVEGHELEVMKGMNFKPAILSFEWISELPTKNVACLRRAGELGFTRFNLATRAEEVMSPDDQWMTFEEAEAEFERLKREDRNNNTWGNAWCI